MKNQRLAAQITGWSLILMTLLSGYALGYAYQTVYQAEPILSPGQLIRQHLGTYELMIGALGLIVLLDLIVSFGFYYFFQKDNQAIALVATGLRMVYSIVFALAIYRLAQNLKLPGDGWIMENFRLFQFTWSLGLIIFGVHLILIGILMKIHKKIPNVFWYLMLLAGFSYSLIHTLKIALPQIQEVTQSMETLLAAPMALGEILFAVWLVIKGGRVKATP
ncbi:MAG: DUF4386 domain-containing protein [Bacteroidales bacterium]|nr:DUF4386 domain-containing protein [Bacteroidales bacterium]